MVVVKGETKQVVWVVMTEVNEYKNIAYVCATHEKAVEVKRQMVEADKWDYVYILAVSFFV
jgi:hypothetical protein